MSGAPQSRPLRGSTYTCGVCGNGPFEWPYATPDHWEHTPDCPRCGSIEQIEKVERPRGAGLIVDSFAGGGGASTGIELALGRAVDIAINHDEQAIRMHEVNHPGTRHIRNNIWLVDPREVTGGEPVKLAWFSPDCKHFSKAKGGKPREKSIRDLAWIVVLWADRVKPDVILLENVEEFRTWGPLCDEGKPIKNRMGETFDKWCRALRTSGYKLEFRELRACDYGAPTIRKRFFMIARRDGLPIAWPQPTHAPADADERQAWMVRQRKAGFRPDPAALKPWRTAAEIIDWSIPCPSIFERRKPLADKTLRRIALGVMKRVVNNPKPFIVPLTHHGEGPRGASVDSPLATVTGANRGEQAIVAPIFARTAHGDVDKNGKRRGQGSHSADEPFPTISTSQDSALVAAKLAPVIVGTAFKNTRASRSFDPAEPTRTQTSQSEYGVAAAHLAPFSSYAQQGGGNRSVEDPLHTVTASDGDHNTVVSATIVGCGGRRGQSAPVDVAAPYPTTTTKADACVVVAFIQKFASGNVATDAIDPIQTVEGNAKHSVVAAHLAQFSETREGRKPNPGHSPDTPVSTIVQKGPLQAVVASNLVKLRGGDESHLHSSSVPVDEPLHTVCAGGFHMAEVQAFLIKYYGNEQDGHGLANPLGTVTTQDRFGLVTVMIDGEEYVIVDIGMRMLTPRELFNAQGFPPDYIIEYDSSGAPITKTAQVAKCGNSVCPPLATALVTAQFPEECAQREQVAA